MAREAGPTAVTISPAHPDEPDGQVLIAELAATLLAATGHFTWSYSAADLRRPRGAFVIARTSEGTPVGCGALRPYTQTIGELKRMYARPGTRGVGAAILAHLEELARGWGYRALWLETGRENTAAIAFYARHGYEPVPNFGPYAGRANAVCFGKNLAQPRVEPLEPLPG